MNLRQPFAVVVPEQYVLDEMIVTGRGEGRFWVEGSLRRKGVKFGELDNTASSGSDMAILAVGLELLRRKGWLAIGCRDFGFDNEQQALQVIKVASTGILDDIYKGILGQFFPEEGRIRVSKKRNKPRVAKLADEAEGDDVDDTADDDVEDENDLNAGADDGEGTPNTSTAPMGMHQLLAQLALDMVASHSGIRPINIASPHVVGFEDKRLMVVGLVYKFQREYALEAVANLLRIPLGEVTDMARQAVEKATQAGAWGQMYRTIVKVMAEHPDGQQL